MVKNKRGQELSTNAIIMIIIGIIVLVVLVLGFTIGWNKFLPFLSSNNVDRISTLCTSACSQNSQYDYCNLPREVNDGVNDKFTATCQQLVSGSVDLPGGGTIDTSSYGIADCTTITCTTAP